MWVTLASWFRKLSWIVLAIGLLHVCHVEIGYPPSKNPGKPKRPISQQRWEYIAFLAAGIPGAAWGIARACALTQRTPWE